MYLVLPTVFLLIASAIIYTKYQIWKSGFTGVANHFVDFLFMWFSETDLIAAKKSTHKIKMILCNIGSLLLLMSIVGLLLQFVIFVFGFF